MDIELLKRKLHDGGHSLVVGKDGGEARAFSGRGVADLLRLLTDEPESLRGAWVADKVVGKGAAALMALGGVERLYADVISRPALALLAGYDIEVDYGTLADNILNRDRSGFCPVETLCRDAATAEDCLPLIRGFAARMAGN